ncbi:MAG TPA: reverse transcriptase domain-containing protein [Labilithrix sp.]
MPHSFDILRGRSLVEALGDESRYDRQLDRLAARARGRRLETLVHDGVRFAQMMQERERVVSLLARAMVDASFRPGAPRVTRARIGGKERDVARIGAIDLLAGAVVAEILAERIEPTLSDRLYSYRRGRSSWQALRSLAAFARAHRAARPDPRTRGIYVLRSDVASYTDSIPLGEGSLLLRELDEAIEVPPSHVAMLHALVAPRETGLLFGAPTTNVLGNLYLRSLDAKLEKEGAYARYGDDVLFAHEDPARVREALAILKDTLAVRGLRANEKKLRVLYWNGAARASREWPEAIATTDVPFLGACVRFRGTIALAPAKWTALLGELRARVRRTARLAEEATPKGRAKLLASVVNQAFDVRSDLALPHAGLVARLVDDRAQLGELDYWIARMIAESSGDARGVRAFREMPWHTQRRLGLASRVRVRNEA